MVVDYKNWEKHEFERFIEIGERISDKLEKGEKISFTSLVPELNLNPSDHYTIWSIPGKPETKQIDPICNLENLTLLYNKIMIPIYLYPSKQDFEYRYAMSFETLIEEIKNNPNRYIPILVAFPLTDYKKAGFYNALFKICQEIYGQYPTPLYLRSTSVKLYLRITPHEKTLSNKEILQKFSKFHFNYILNKELKTVFDRNEEAIFCIAYKYHSSKEIIKRYTVSDLQGLRIFEYEEYANIVLDIYNKTKNFELLYFLLRLYNRYLISPINSLGAFQNYRMDDLEAMTFLRIIPLEKTDILNLRDRFRMIANSPATRSFITLPSYKMNVFLNRITDIKTLNKIHEIAERHKKETKELANYRKMIAEGNLNEALLSFKKMELVYKQISDEIKEWQQREKIAEWSIEAGTTILSGIPTILSNIPSEWKLVILIFTNLLAKFLKKKLDPKSIVESIYDVKSWPWYEKGIPYLYWKCEKSKIS
ncbi:MAG: hypothetical protein QW272_05305 [Candidatus Methanomethylicaceae archaeon]